MKEETIDDLIRSMQPDSTYMIGASGLNNGKTLEQHLQELSEVIVEDYMNRMKVH
jgi:hypothetical protein